MCVYITCGSSVWMFTSSYTCYSVFAYSAPIRMYTASYHVLCIVHTRTYIHTYIHTHVSPCYIALPYIYTDLYIAWISSGVYHWNSTVARGNLRHATYIIFKYPRGSLAHKITASFLSPILGSLLRNTLIGNIHVYNLRAFKVYVYAY